MTDFEQKLNDAATDWLMARPPFVVRGHSRRLGVDCVHLAHALYTAAGVELSPIPRDYFIDETRHNRTRKLIDWIEKSGRFRPVPVGSQCKVGTLLCAEIGLAPYHVAVVFAPGRAIHAIRHQGVCSISLADPTFDKVKNAFEVIL